MPRPTDPSSSPEPGSSDYCDSADDEISQPDSDVLMVVDGDGAPEADASPELLEDPPGEDEPVECLYPQLEHPPSTRPTFELPAGYDDFMEDLACTALRELCFWSWHSTSASTFRIDAHRRQNTWHRGEAEAGRTLAICTPMSTFSWMRSPRPNECGLLRFGSALDGWRSGQ